MSKIKEERFEQIGSKIDPAMAEVLNACCDALQVDIYHLIQWFCYVIVKASAPMHALDPRIQKLMAMLESDAGWQNAFNLCNPDDLNVSQVILILEQKKTMCLNRTTQTLTEKHIPAISLIQIPLAYRVWKFCV